jgi:hypothetical protein
MEQTNPAVNATGLSRRGLLLGAGGLGAAAAWTVAGPLASAQAAAPSTPAAVITEAKSYNTYSLAKMNSIWSSKYDTEGDWCSIFVSWCLRGTKTGFSTQAHVFYALCTPVSAANVKQGDIVWYYVKGHIGLVRSHSDGHIRTVEGNAGANKTPSTSEVKEYPDPWNAAVKYARPKY